jgi:preprotein translocase subunit SecB
MKLKKLQLKFLHFWVLESKFKFLPEIDEKSTNSEEIPIDIDYKILQAAQTEHYRIEVSIKSIENRKQKYPYFFYVRSAGIFELTSEIDDEQKRRLIVRMALPLVISSVRSYITNNSAYSPLRRYYLPVIDMNELIKDKIKSEAKKAKMKSK